MESHPSPTGRCELTTACSTDFVELAATQGTIMKKIKREKPQPSFYDQLRIKLEQERIDLQRLIQSTEKELLKLVSDNPEILGDIGPDQERLIEKSSRYRERLAVVKHAFERIRDGSFGRCALCEEPIAPKRLEALPTARYCRECQEQVERCEPQVSNSVFDWRRG